uniref:Uncharacterized protein n=1 Tax=Avena sativa TaxID=4498 RepID=A0ACD5WX90_AVESA
MLGGRGGSQKHGWDIFAAWGSPLPPARAPWAPPNAVGVLGPRPCTPHQVYPAFYPASTPGTPYATPTPYSFDHTTLLHQAMSNSSYPPQPPEWIMDFGASSHVTDKMGNMTTTHSSLGHGNSQHIIVGSKIPILAIGSVQISSLALYLQNVLVSPTNVKDLISVHQLTRDHYVSIEFDPFGFSVKDLATKTLLICSNSEGYLYPFHGSTSPMHTAFTTTAMTFGIGALGTLALLLFPIFH